MTTNKTATLDTINLIVTGLPAVATPKPSTVILSGPCIPVMQQLAHLVRLGYVPDSNVPFEYFGYNGAMAITLVRGAPDQTAIDAAVQTLHDSQAVQDAEFARAVTKEAARQIAVAKQAEDDAKRAKLIEEQRAVLAALEASLAAPRQVLATLEASTTK